MARPRTGCLRSFGGERPHDPNDPTAPVWVKVGRGGRGFSVFVVTEVGTREFSKPTEAAAFELAARKALDVSMPTVAAPLHALVYDYLVVRRTETMGDAYVEQMQDLARKWLAPFLGRPCGTIDETVPEAVVTAMVVAGAAPWTERHFRRFWGRLCAHGKQWKFMRRDQDTAPRTKARPIPKVKVTGDDSKVWSRSDLPAMEDIERQAQLAAELTGHWWEELRILFLATVGPRWGEHASLVGDDFDLDAHEVSIRWALRQQQGEKVLFELDFTKNATTRVVSWPAHLDEMLSRRVLEVGPRGLMFPGPSGPGPAAPSGPASAMAADGTFPVSKERADVSGSWASRHWWRRMVFLPTGKAVGWPVAGRRTEPKRRDGGRVSSLLWGPHEAYRHTAATWMLSPCCETDWREGLGLTLIDVAYALGDTVETIERIYVGRSQHSRARVVAANRRAR